MSCGEMYDARHKPGIKHDLEISVILVDVKNYTVAFAIGSIFAVKLDEVSSDGFIKLIAASIKNAE